jgi:hypothetical protein
MTLLFVTVTDVAVCYRHSRAHHVIPVPITSFPRASRHSRAHLVIPAQAGIQPID